ncbi:hypothetical protein Syun_011378 [Stephania yunnanensis]|uniref:Uncharacterized protein n=1 Tax=Stephania yunnanensis TaxID=152371 RepID=A0AAP0JYN5_9MAGN
MSKREDEKNLNSERERVSVESNTISPYVNYIDLEDYKMKAYGTEGHVEPKQGLGGGATDAPTQSGSAKEEEEIWAVNSVNRPVQK